MPVTFLCGCGKTKRVKDRSAALRAKCVGCGSTLDSATELPDDLDVVEDDPTPTRPEPAATQVEPVAAGPAAAKRVAEPPPAVPPKKLKKKKKKRTADDEETAEERLERVRAAEARVGRVMRGVAFIVLGAAILIGVLVMFTVYGAEMKDMGLRANVGATLMGVLGVAAIGKGLVGLFLGQFLGED